MVGRLGRPHGLKGFLGLYVDPEDLPHFEPGSTVFVGDETYVVKATRPADRGPQVLFEGVSDRNAAETIRGQDVSVEIRRQLGDGEYWPEDLVGLEVVTESGTVLGNVTSIVFGAAQDRLVVGEPNGVEIPFVNALVPKVDVEAGRIEVVDLPGLTEQPR